MSLGYRVDRANQAVRPVKAGVATFGDAVSEKCIGLTDPYVPEGMTNTKLATGAIELRDTELEVLNKYLVPPVSPSGTDVPNEDLRLKHRYLDLRRPEMQQVMLLRDLIFQQVSNLFISSSLRQPTMDVLLR